jgi:hypothetical protein
MSVELKGYHIAILLILGAIAAYGILALRLPANLAFALSVFGTCVLSLFIFAFRLARQESQHHHD